MVSHGSPMRVTLTKRVPISDMLNISTKYTVYSATGVENDLYEIKITGNEQISLLYLYKMLTDPC